MGHTVLARRAQRVQHALRLQQLCVGQQGWQELELCVGYALNTRDKSSTRLYKWVSRGQHVINWGSRAAISLTCAWCAISKDLAEEQQDLLQKFIS